ncbi:WD40 repeat-like protein [Annulohypoxylon maeteangense]|uniref:WD40 repeat-like protein n=1 Tax=Annulohypoxylon maeteangense TaxID=1927788 RepID=UPI0020075E29|nr:WD40 repeat-like protein [Annulohypoxylon maeteangense]KAI0889843.1 WD40 repeat-like protein [Annulohypoxylon maeteangense]
MRLRKSNQRKRFNTSTVLDLSDGEQSTTVNQSRQSSDEEFVVDTRRQQPLDEDEHGADPQDSSDFEVNNGKKSESRRRKNRRSWAVSNATKSFSKVEPYPTDPSQKWTRTYVGPVKRWTRLLHLVDYWFGEMDNRREIFNGFMNLWFNFQLVPPKLTLGSEQLEMARNGWMPDNFAQDMEDKFRSWYLRYLSMANTPQTSTLIDETKALRWFLPQAKSDMGVLLGHVSDQKEYRIKQGESIPFSDYGIPIEVEGDDEVRSGGWLLDVGGIVLSMGWAPIKGEVDQFLAMATIPYSDQAYYKNLDDMPKGSDMKEGTIQIWRFKAEKDNKGVLRPARSSPKLAQALCFHWGRALRMQWCPVPLSIEDNIALVAALCGDGTLRVIKVNLGAGKDSEGTFEELQDPMVTIRPPKEHTVEINCFTWCNMNRIAVALSDGSVVLWSLSPCLPLMRHPVHGSPIMDIVSGYPSNSFIVATMPMGGMFTLTDLNRPTAEKTYHGNPVVSLQPNTLVWNDHLRGFASIWPTSFPGTSTISFVHSRVFPLSRHICTVEGQTMCLAFGKCHPYLLAGSSDGSVWALNVLRKMSSHRDKTHKLKIFQHEYCAPRPSGAATDNHEQSSQRGTCRIIHGFLPQVNIHPLGVRVAKESRVKRAKKAKGKEKANEADDGPASDDTEREDDENFTMVPGPITIHEPLTRVTALSWNPNAEFGWWAAAAMGSGLVRIMDLGIEDDEEKSHEQRGQPGSFGPEDGTAGDPDGLNDEDEMEEDSDADINMTLDD